MKHFQAVYACGNKLLIKAIDAIRAKSEAVRLGKEFKYDYISHPIIINEM